jgi:hypothetical protein
MRGGAHLIASSEKHVLGGTFVTLSLGESRLVAFAI